MSRTSYQSSRHELFQSLTSSPSVLQWLGFHTQEQCNHSGQAPTALCALSCSFGAWAPTLLRGSHRDSFPMSSTLPCQLYHKANMPPLLQKHFYGFLSLLFPGDRKSCSSMGMFVGRIRCNTYFSLSPAIGIFLEDAQCPHLDSQRGKQTLSFQYQNMCSLPLKWRLFRNNQTTLELFLLNFDLISQHSKLPSQTALLLAHSGGLY